MDLTSESPVNIDVFPLAATAGVLRTHNSGSGAHTTQLTLRLPW